MSNFIVERGQFPQREQPKSNHKVAAEIKTFVKGWPVNEESWNHHFPHSDDGILELFRNLTLSHIQSETRKKMAYDELLEILAGKIDTKSETQIMILFGVCEVVMKLEKLTRSTVYEILRRVLGMPERRLDRMRTAMLKCIQLQNTLDKYRAVDLYTYIMLDGRDKPCLNMLAGFTKQHFSLLDGGLKGGTIKFYKPKRLLDSTCLRCSNVIYVLFAGNLLAEEVIQSLDTWRDQPKGKNSQRVSLPFYAFMSLHKASEGFRETLSREIVGCHPTRRYDQLQHYGQPQPCSQLCGFVQNQAITIGMIAESIGMRIVNIDEVGDYNPATFRLEPGGSIVANGYLGLAVLLHGHAVEMRMVPDKEKMEQYQDKITEELKWEPNQVLCFMDKALEAKNEKNRIFFVLVLVKVVPI
ncbi:hypothetical protein BKA56DRAFT_600881 [Ilyonectria sp. MPI-CAGE-AT-0026]|nr:hypothetical protein BKA56DRAFT_600881 [Ilyonectria sp. MPI-CAGE-AT-0026]